MHNEKVKHWSNDAISLNISASVHPCHKALPPRHPFPPHQNPQGARNLPIFCLFHATMLSGGCWMNLFPEKSSSVRHPAVLTIPTPIILHWTGYFSGGNRQFSSLFSPAWWPHWRHQFCYSHAQTGSQATGQDHDALTLAVHCAKHHHSYEHNMCLGNAAALILTSLVNITAITCCSSASMSHWALVPHCKLTTCYPLCSAKILWAQLPPSWPCLLRSTTI